MSESKSGSFEEAVKSSAEAHMVKTRGTSATRFDSFIAGSKWALEYLAKAAIETEKGAQARLATHYNEALAPWIKEVIVNNFIAGASHSNARNVILEQRVKELEERLKTICGDDDSANLVSKCHFYETKSTHLQAANTQLTAALEFYGNEKNHLTDQFGNDSQSVNFSVDLVTEDCGKLARATLEKIKGSR